MPIISGTISSKSMDGFRWPNLCARCGNNPPGRMWLYIDKRLKWWLIVVWSHEVRRINVPVCPACYSYLMHKRDEFVRWSSDWTWLEFRSETFQEIFDRVNGA